MDSSMSGFPVHHQLPELTQTHVHRVGDAIQPSISSSVIPFSHLQSFPASESFPMSQLFASGGGQSIGASASASVLPLNIQDWFPLGLPQQHRDSLQSFLSGITMPPSSGQTWEWTRRARLIGVVVTSVKGSRILFPSVTLKALSGTRKLLINYLHVVRPSKQKNDNKNETSFSQMPEILDHFHPSLSTSQSISSKAWLSHASDFPWIIREATP